MKKIGYFSVMTCFLAANLFAVNFGTVQMSLYRLSLMGAGAMLLLPLAGMKTSAKIKNNASSHSFSLWFMLIWFCWGLISFLWIKDISLWIKAIYFLGTGLFWSVYYSLYFNEEKDFKIVFNLMQIMIILVGFIGWYEVATKDYRFIELTPQNIHAYVDAPARVPIALSGNPNDFALLVLFGIFISWICFKSNKSFLGKAISLYAMASAAGLLAFTESRANILGLIMGLGLFVVLSFKNKKRMVLLILLGIAGMAVFVASPIFGVILEKVSEVMRFNFNQPGYNSESVRVNLLINGLHFLLESCWLGTGAGNIEYWMAHDTIVNTNGYVNIHNWWMEILASYGALIFILYVIFYCNLFKNLLKKYKAAKDNSFAHVASAGLMCCMGAFIIGSISSSSNMKAEWLWVFWAVVIAFTNQKSEIGGDSPDR